MKYSNNGNLILDYEEQTNLAILAVELLKYTKDSHSIQIAMRFLDWVGDNLEPEEDQ